MAAPLNPYYINITGPMLTLGKFTLPTTPTDPNKVLVDINEGTTALIPGTDFVVIGNELMFGGYQLESLLVVGQRVRVVF